MVAIITIPKKLYQAKELVIMPRKEYEELLRSRPHRKKEKIREKDVLRWAKEAEKLADHGKLPVLHSLRDFR